MPGSPNQARISPRRIAQHVLEHSTLHCTVEWVIARAQEDATAIITGTAGARVLSCDPAEALGRIMCNRLLLAPNNHLLHSPDSMAMFLGILNRACYAHNIVTSVTLTHTEPSQDALPIACFTIVRTLPVYDYHGKLCTGVDFQLPPADYTLTKFTCVTKRRVEELGTHHVGRH